MTRFVPAQLRAALDDASDVAALQAERDELKRSIQAFIRTLMGAALDNAGEELQRLGSRRDKIETAWPAFLPPIPLTSSSAPSASACRRPATA